MRNFNDYLISEFEEEYTKYYTSIVNNMCNIFYNGALLSNITPLLERHKVFEHNESKLLNHFIRLIWSDLILSFTRIFEQGKDILGIIRCKNMCRNNCKPNIDNRTLFPRAKYFDGKFEKSIIDCRNQSIAHSLDDKLAIILHSNEIVKYVKQFNIYFNDNLFRIGNKLEVLSNKKITELELSAQKGLSKLIKESGFKELFEYISKHSPK